MNNFYDNEKLEQLKAKSAFSMPDNPSNRGWSASQIKRTLYEPSLMLFELAKELETNNQQVFDDLKNTKTDKTDFDSSFINIDTVPFNELSQLDESVVYKGILNNHACLFIINKLDSSHLSLKVLFNDVEQTGKGIFGKEIIIDSNKKVVQDYAMSRILDFKNLTTLQDVLKEITKNLNTKEYDTNTSWLVKYNTNDSALIFIYYKGETTYRYSILREKTLYDSLVEITSDNSFKVTIDEGIKAHFDNIIANLKSQIDYLNANVVLTISQDLNTTRQEQARKNIGVINGAPIITLKINFDSQNKGKITAEEYANINKYEKCYLQIVGLGLFVYYTNSNSVKRFAQIGFNSVFSAIKCIDIDQSLNVQLSTYNLYTDLKVNENKTNIKLSNESSTSGKGIDFKTINNETLLENGNISLINTNEKGKPNGVPTLDENGHIPTSQIPGSVNEYEEYESCSLFPPIGTSDKIYLDLKTNKSYRWSGSQYSLIASDLALGETSSTAYAGDKGKENADNIANLKNDKLSKVTEQEKVYATDGLGSQTTIQYNVEPYGDGLAKRTSDGRVKGNEGTEANDLVNKTQLDKSVNGKQNKLVEGKFIKINQDTNVIDSDIAPNTNNLATETLETLTFGNTTYVVTPNTTLSLTDITPTTGFTPLSAIKVKNGNSVDVWKIIDEQKVQEMIDNTLSGAVNKEY